VERHAAAHLVAVDRTTVLSRLRAPAASPHRANARARGEYGRIPAAFPAARRRCKPAVLWRMSADREPPPVCRVLWIAHAGVGVRCGGLPRELDQDDESSKRLVG